MKVIIPSVVSNCTTLVAVLLLVLLLIVQEQQHVIFVNGYPNGAGSCIGNGPAVGGAHLSSGGTITNGTLSNYSLALLLDDNVLTPTYPQQRYLTSFETNTMFNLILDAPQGNMKGCMIRLSTLTNASKDVFNLQLLDDNDDTNNVKISDECSEFDDAIAITHTNNNKKVQCAGTINVIYSGIIHIDVTAVIELVPGVQSTYVYDRYELQSDATLPPVPPLNGTTVAPASTPTNTTNVTTPTAPTATAPMDGSDAPSSSPSDVPSDSPNSIPSIVPIGDMPSRFPTIDVNDGTIVTREPVSSPVRVPVIAPTSAPISSAFTSATTTNKNQLLFTISSLVMGLFYFAV